MISSRDFLLFIIVVLCLLGGIFYTLAREYSRPSVALLESDATYTAEVENAPYDTAARLRTLQQKLTAGEGALESAPATFTSLDQLREEEAREAARVAAEEAAARAAAAAPQYCGQRTSPALWNGVSGVAPLGGQIAFYRQANGTSTEEALLFSLPQRSVRNAADSCLDNDIIGATADGRPLLNTTVSAYSGAAGSFIGYTRDGFTLYGPISDPETLDACGGRYEGGVYRYHVRVGAPVLVSCFAGVPTQIILNN